MAIYISPRGLSVAELNNKIQHISLETWLCDIDGDLTYNSPQWLNEAWFHPRVERNKLIYGIIGRRDSRMTKHVYAVFHARFIEMLLSNFDKEIASIQCSSLADPDFDSFK